MSLEEYKGELSASMQRWIDQDYTNSAAAFHIIIEELYKLNQKLGELENDR